MRQRQHDRLPQPTDRERARLFYDGALVMDFDTFAEARAAVLALPSSEWPRYTIKHEVVLLGRTTDCDS